MLSFRNPDRNSSAVQALTLLANSRSVLFPDAYSWFILLSALDVMITHAILFHFKDYGSYEANPIADYLIRRFDMTGAIALKFLVVILVILTAELVGRVNLKTSRQLMTAVLGIACVPLVVGLGHLARIAIGG